jgi:cytochrome c oxidase subunit 2
MRIDFQDPATAIMEGIIDFHHDIQFYLIIIVTFVAWSLLSIVYEFGIQMYILQDIHLEDTLEARKYSLVVKGITHGTVLEIVWTILPVFVLIAIAVPSFALLYSIDELIEPTLTVKIIGHQWYWSYEYSDYEEGDLMFDSYMLTEEDLEPGQLRLLDVDRKLWLPTFTHIRLLVTASDVIHSWAVPSFGVKMDCLPGRLNQVSLFIKREGVFYGQCSELCGVNHGFMPIAVKAVPIDLFNFWVSYNLNEL